MSTTDRADPLCLITAAALSVVFQVSFSKVQQALRAINAQPHLTLNGIEHYDEAAVVEQCREWLRGTRDGRRIETRRGEL